jgi:hypothetical protein
MQNPQGFDSWQWQANSFRLVLEPFRLPFTGNREHFHQVNSGRRVKVTTLLHSLPSLRMLGVIPPLPSTHHTFYPLPVAMFQQVIPSVYELHAGGRKLSDSKQSRAVPARSTVPTALYSRRRPCDAAPRRRRSQHSKLKLFLCTP